MSMGYYIIHANVFIDDQRKARIQSYHIII